MIVMVMMIVVIVVVIMITVAVSLTVFYRTAANRRSDNGSEYKQCDKS